MSFRLLVGIYCHNISTHTPPGGYHGVTEVAKPAKKPKRAKNSINCMSARPTPQHANPMGSGRKNTLLPQNRKKHQKIHDFEPKKKGDHPPPPPVPPPSKAQKKWVSSGGVWTKNSSGDAFIGQNNDFTTG